MLSTPLEHESNNALVLVQQRLLAPTACRIQPSRSLKTQGPSCGPQRVRLSLPRRPQNRPPIFGNSQVKPRRPARRCPRAFGCRASALHLSLELGLPKNQGPYSLQGDHTGAAYSLVSRNQGPLCRCQRARLLLPGHPQKGSPICGNNQLLDACCPSTLASQPGLVVNGQTQPPTS